MVLAGAAKHQDGGGICRRGADLQAVQRRSRKAPEGVCACRSFRNSSPRDAEYRTVSSQRCSDLLLALHPSDRCVLPLCQVGTQAGFVNGCLLGLVFFIAFSADALALWYGSVRIIAGAMDGGDVVTVRFDGPQRWCYQTVLLDDCHIERNHDSSGYRRTSRDFRGPSSVKSTGVRASLCPREGLKTAAVRRCCTAQSWAASRWGRRRRTSSTSWPGRRPGHVCSRCSDASRSSATSQVT